MVSLPIEFINRMRKLLGDEAEAFFESYEKERAFGFRVNPAKVDADVFEKMAPFTLRSIPWADFGYFYDAEDRPGRHPWHDAGLYYIQEPSAMSPAQLLHAEPGERVLDLCAAPGGKSTQIAGQMRGEGVLVSNEIHPERAKILSQNIERMGFGNVLVLNESPASLKDRFVCFFDRIMVDAPCSGEGMFRKDGEARNQWSETHVQLCADRQDEILDCASEMLKAGGRLVYSTCTFAPEEDEGSIARFMRRHPEFSVVYCEDAYEGFSTGCPEWASVSNQSAKEKELGAALPAKSIESLKYTFRIWPHRMDGEGHYIAVLKKNGNSDTDTDADIDRDVEAEQGEISRKSQKSQKSKKEVCSSSKRMDSKLLEQYQNFVKETFLEPEKWLNTDRLLLFGENLYYLPEGISADFKGLKVLRPGLHLGTFKKNRFEPSHAWALYLHAEDVRQKKNCTSADGAVLPYLRGETLPADEDLEKGWVLVLVDGFSIGWAKAAGGVLKNHYPKGLRYMGR